MYRNGRTRSVSFFLSALLITLTLSSCSGGLFDKYYNQGVSQYKKRQYAEAMNSFMLAYRQADHFDAGDERRVKTLNQLADCYFLLGMLPEMEATLKKLLQEQVKEESAVEATKLKLASCLEAQRKFSDALVLRREVLASMSKRVGRDMPQTLSVAQGCANNLIMSNDLAEADKTFQKIIALEEKRLGKTNPQLAPRLKSYADLLKKEKKTKEADKIMARVKTLQSSAAPALTKAPPPSKEIKW